MSFGYLRVGSSAIKKTNLITNCSKNFKLTFDPQNLGMRSHQLCLCRRIASCNSFKPLNFNTKIKIISYNYSAKSMLRLSNASASYSCVKPASAFQNEFCQSASKTKNPSKENFNQSPGTCSIFTRNKRFLSKLNGSGAGAGSHTTNFRSHAWNEGKNVFMSFGKCLVPVTPSLDDIQVKNCNIGIQCCDKSAISKSYDIYSCFDQNIVNILPRIFRSNIVESSKETKAVDVNEHQLYSALTSKYNEDIQKNVLYCSSNAVSSPSEEKPKQLGKPSDEQLTKVFDELTKELPNLFVKSLNYKIYSAHIVFENRITGNRSVGIFHYIRQASFLRLLGHIKFAFVKFQILKITKHPENSTIRVRWRIVGVSALKSLPLIFSLKSYSMKEASDKMDDWYDGFSTFHVAENGLIDKHVADKMMPDDEHELVPKPSLTSRLAALVGLSSKPPSTAVTTSVIEVNRQKTPLPSDKYLGVV